MKKIFILIYISYILYFANCIDDEIKWKVSDNLKSSIYSKKNVDLTYENNIPLYYSIKNEKYKIDSNTDLYISFDNENQLIDYGKYRIINKKFLYSENKSVLNKSAFFTRSQDRIELIGTSNSFFQSGINLGSFTLSFWIYPLTFSNNDTVMKIGSQYYNNSLDEIEDQSINAKIMDGKIFWEFNNIFSLNNKNKKTFVLKSSSRIIPEKWSHINLTFDAQTGIIKENINGMEEGIIIATVDSTLNSSVLDLQYSPSNRCIIQIAPLFYGGIDELCITSKVQDLFTDKFPNKSGELVSKVIDFGINTVSIYQVIFDDEKDNNSEIYYFYRNSNEPFGEEEDMNSKVLWLALDKKNINLAGIRYFQWKALLFPGINNQYSPKFIGIDFKYHVDDHPSKPLGFKAMMIDNKLKLKWIPNSESKLKGYKIYYGIKSGSYFSKDASQGASPIDVGPITNFEITGLNKEKIYYFVITAYDDDKHKHESDFSEEISIRPYFSD